MTDRLRSLPLDALIVWVLVGVAFVAALVALLTAIFGQPVSDLLASVAPLCAPCADPSNGMPTAAAAAGAAAGTAAAGSAAPGGPRTPPRSSNYDPREYHDPQEVSRLAREARDRLDPRNSPGATEARETGGGARAPGAPSVGVGQSYDPRPAPTAAPPKTFKETIDSDRGWSRYGPRWPAPTPTPGSSH